MTDLFDMGSTRSEASFSSDNLYRFTLTRVWDKDKKQLIVIGLNPSTADAMKDDATIRRLIHPESGFARQWGFGSLLMLNLFAYRATQPSEMKKVSDPIGPNNDGVILRAVRARRAINDRPTVLCAWGAHGAFKGRGLEVAKMLLAEGIELQCLGVTDNGHPLHPLRLWAGEKLRPLALMSA